MDKSVRRKITITAVLILLAAVVFTSGCIGVFDPTPKEVKIRGNIISVDSGYISDGLIWGLCFNPNDYGRELFNAVGNYLPSENAVIEVGAGIGALSAYINDHLILSSNHIAVEPNPHLMPVLEKTKELNELGCTFIQKAVAYGSDTTTITVNSNIINNQISGQSNIVETVEVGTTTLQQITEGSMFSSKNNLTIVLDINGYEHTVIQREAVFIRDNVKTLIAAVGTENKNNPDTFAYIMDTLGFKLESNVFDETSSLNVMVFTKE